MLEIKWCGGVIWFLYKLHWRSITKDTPPANLRYHKNSFGELVICSGRPPVHSSVGTACSLSRIYEIISARIHILWLIEGFNEQKRTIYSTDLLMTILNERSAIWWCIMLLDDFHIKCKDLYKSRLNWSLISRTTYLLANIRWTRTENRILRLRHIAFCIAFLKSLFIF